jgi:hypothetical protein
MRLGDVADTRDLLFSSTHRFVILSQAKNLQCIQIAHHINRERPKEANPTACAAGASARAASA